MTIFNTQLSSTDVERLILNFSTPHGLIALSQVSKTGQQILSNEYFQTILGQRHPELPFKERGVVQTTFPDKYYKIIFCHINGISIDIPDLLLPKFPEIAKTVFRTQSPHVLKLTENRMRLQTEMVKIDQTLKDLLNELDLAKIEYQKQSKKNTNLLQIYDEMHEILALCKTTGIENPKNAALKLIELATSPCLQAELSKDELSQLVMVKLNAESATLPQEALDRIMEICVHIAQYKPEALEQLCTSNVKNQAYSDKMFTLSMQGWFQIERKEVEDFCRESIVPAKEKHDRLEKTIASHHEQKGALYAEILDINDTIEALVTKPFSKYEMKKIKAYLRTEVPDENFSGKFFQDPQFAKIAAQAFKSLCGDIAIELQLLR